MSSHPESPSEKPVRHSSSTNYQELMRAATQEAAVEVEARQIVLPPGFEIKYPPGSHIDRWQAHKHRPPHYQEEPYFPEAEGRRMQDQAERAFDNAKHLISKAVADGQLPSTLRDRLHFLDQIEIIGDPNNMRFGYSGDTDTDGAGIYGAPEFAIELSLPNTSDDKATELAVHESLHALSGVDFTIDSLGLADARTGLSIRNVKPSGSHKQIPGVNHWLSEAVTDILTIEVAGDLSRRVGAASAEPRFYHEEIAAFHKLTELASVPLQEKLVDLYFAEHTWTESLQAQAELFDRAFEPGFLAYVNSYDDEEAIAYIKSI